MENESNLAKILHKIESLGAMPSEWALLEARLNSVDMQSWYHMSATLITNEADRRPRYYLQWIWRGLQPSENEKQHGIRVARARVYWRYVLENLEKAGGGLSPYESHLRAEFDRVEREFLSWCDDWISQRLRLESALVQNSNELKCFRDGLLKAVSQSEDFVGENRFLFVSSYWPIVLEALIRFCKIQVTSARPLKITEHTKNRELAQKLQTNLKHQIQLYPQGYEPSYERFLNCVTEFIESPDPTLIPKRSHPNAARQVLIRELLLAWLKLSRQITGKFKTDLAPKKLVYFLIRAVCSDDVPAANIRKQIRENYSEVLIGAEE